MSQEQNHVHFKTNNMTITELRDKYQKKLESLDEIILHPNSAFLSRKDKIKKQKHIEKFISDLNALIQSEDRERRELLLRYTDYLTETTKYLTIAHKEFRKVVIDRFLESEKGGEG